MHPTSHSFPDNAKEALANAPLQQALGTMKKGFVERRAAAAANLPEFEALRDQGRDIKDHVLANLDRYLERYEAAVTAQGGVVHWARNAAEARQIILELCQSRNARLVTKGKSMISEEIGLNQALEAAKVQVVETDLGEYIIQLRKEAPSHIIAPAIHVLKEQVADDFRQHHQHLPPDRPLSEAQTLVREARMILRERYGQADVGITGANFLIADTGSSIIVTNEGNGDLTQNSAKMHIVLASIDKIVPTLPDASALLRLLARSATGQEFSAYTTISTGPRRPEDLDGPEAYHVVLLDNGRSAMLGSPYQDMLRCIRCGACMNHCPVYGAVGGHAYGWVYPGPMGSVLTPSFLGVEEAHHLPFASTFCGRCEAVCPMRIPLPKMMRHYRAQAFEKKQLSVRARWGMALWALLVQQPRLYQWLTRAASWGMARIARGKGGLNWLPLAGGWTDSRLMPAPEGETFQARWARRNQAK